MFDHRAISRLIPILWLMFVFFTAAGDIERVEIYYTGTFGKFFYGYRMSEGTIFGVRKSKAESLAQQTAAGSVRLAVAPRPLPGPGLTSVPIAYQATLLAVHPTCKLKNITSAQVRALLEENRGSWRTFGGPSARIRLYARAEPELPPPVLETEHQHIPARPRTILEPAPLGEPQKTEPKPVPTIQYFRPLRVQTESDRSSFIMLCTDPRGMACFDITRYDEDRVPLLSVDGIAPTLEHFRSGKYPLTTIWYLTFPEKPTAAERALIRYIRSEKFAVKLYEDGMLPELPEKNGRKPPSAASAK